MTKKRYRNGQYKLVLIALFAALLAGCNSGEKVDEDLQTAFKIHEEAVEVRKKIADQINTFKENTDSLFVESYKSDLDSIRLLLEAWDDQLVEVPGFDHEHDHSDHDDEHDHSGHDHDHDHDHDHENTPELSPEQHLEVQKHLLSQIKLIAEYVSQLEQL